MLSPDFDEECVHVRKDGKAFFFFFNTPSVVIVSQREGESRGALSDKESPESAPEQFSLQATGQGYFSFALSLLQGFLTLAHPYALPPPPSPSPSVHTCACSPSFSLQIWAIACYFLPSAFPLPSHDLAPFQHQTATEMIWGKSVMLDSEF